METKSRAIIINDITEDISEKLGKLTRYGVLSFEDSIKIIETLNDKQCAWMRKNATSIDIINFLREMKFE